MHDNTSAVGTTAHPTLDEGKARCCLTQGLIQHGCYDINNTCVKFHHMCRHRSGAMSCLSHVCGTLGNNPEDQPSYYNKCTIMPNAMVQTHHDQLKDHGAPCDLQSQHWERERYRFCHLAASCRYAVRPSVQGGPVHVGQGLPGHIPDITKPATHDTSNVGME